MSWSAKQYAKFLDDRTRAARDLLAGVPLAAPAHAVDVGCGPGNSTMLLVERYPEAQVSGIDSDEDMIRAARQALPTCEFERAEVKTWQPEMPLDLIYANASLQWADDHTALFLRLVGLLAPNGALAVQMPDNLDEPSHRAMRKIAGHGPWRGRLAAASSQRKPLIPPAELHALLRPNCARVDVWRTVYNFELAGVDAIVEWFKGSALRPFLSPLNAEEKSSFLAAYREEIAPSYPEFGGRTLLAFPRFFFVAQAKG